METIRKYHAVAEESTRELKYVQMGTLTDEEIMKFAVMEVTKPLYGYKKDEITNTLYDPRMGVLKKNEQCPTCGLDRMSCQGHFGYIALAEPVYNIKMIKIAASILNCICDRCFRLRISKEMMERKGILDFHRNARTREIRKHCKSVKRCIYNDCCSELFPFGTDKVQIVKRVENKKVEPYSAGMVYSIFHNISDETFRLLGFNEDLGYNPDFFDDEIEDMEDISKHLHKISPSSFVINNLLVIPICARPWVKKDDKEKKDDDITSKYNEIIKTNIAIKNIKEKKTETFRRRKGNKPRKASLKDLIEKLTNSIYSLFDSAYDKKEGNGDVKHGFINRIQGKEGRININVNGKRCNFSSRNVIAPGGTMVRPGEIGVPLSEVTKLTKQEIVCSYNIDWLQRLVEEDKVASIKRNGITYTLKYMKEHKRERYDKLKKLCIRDVVMRYIQDGDRVIYNRQPTLRRESKMGAVIKILPAGDQPFRIPLCVCPPLNADFDGDEINIHVLQSQESSAECATIVSTADHIVTPQRNSPVVGLVQDSLISLFLMTRSINGKETMVPRDIFCDCIVHVPNLFSKKRYFDEYQKTFYERCSEYYPDYVDVSIDEEGNSFYEIAVKKKYPGKMLFSCILPPDLYYKKENKIEKDHPCVIIEKGILLPDSGPIDKKIVGPVANSIHHVVYQNKTEDEALELLGNMEQLAYCYITRTGFGMGLDDCRLTEKCKRQIKDHLKEVDLKCEEMLKRGAGEEEINNLMNNARNKCPEYVINGLENKDNAMIVMSACGAKGSAVNLSQFIGFVGQQNIDRRRYPLFIDNKRTLACFAPGDNSPIARGNVYSSFLEGLTPQEYFFHTGGGRKGIIDKGLRACDTGYLQKKIVKKMESIKIETDGTVRNSSGEIIQFLYGEGFDASKLYYVKGYKSPFFADLENVAMSICGEELPARNKQLRPLKRKEIESIIEDMFVGSRPFTTEASKKANENIRSITSDLLSRVRILPDKVEEYKRVVLRQFYRSLVPYGEMVGLVSALSIGEPTTQLVLNVFHVAGIGAKDVTVGLPRIMELLGLSRPSTPFCTVYMKNRGVYKRLTEKIEKSEEAKVDCMAYMENYGEKMRLVSIESMLSSCLLKYIGEEDTKRDPLNLVKYEKHKREWWSLAYEKLFGEIAEEYSWVVELAFDKKRLFRTGLSLKFICSLIETSLDVDSVTVIPSPDCIGRIDIYVSARNKTLTIPSYNGTNRLEDQGDMEFMYIRNSVIPGIKDIYLSGLSNIEDVYVREIEKEFVLETTGTNLRDIMKCYEVDTCRTASNDIWEILCVLGLEAARNSLYKEITNCISFDGAYVNPRHIELLVDSMTNYGTLSPAKRGGIGREVGPLAKGLFERSVENFIYSSCYGEADNLKGVSANIMLGMRANAGTGCVSLSRKKKVKK